MNSEIQPLTQNSLVYIPSWNFEFFSVNMADQNDGKVPNIAIKQHEWKEFITKKKKKKLEEDFEEDEIPEVFTDNLVHVRSEMMISGQEP